MKCNQLTPENPAPCGLTICCHECEKKASCETPCNKDPENCGFANNEETMLKEFESKELALIQEIEKIELAAKRINEEKDQMREKVKMAMAHYGIKSYKTDILSLSYVAEHTQNKFDSKAFEKDHKDLYEQYKKASPVKASITIKLKTE